MMKRTSRTTLAALVCATALFGTAACGSSDSGSTAKPKSNTSSKMSQSPSADAAMSDLVGPGCGAYAKAVPSGAGSVEGMAKDKVPAAASNNPLLTTLVKAVSGKLNPKVNLVDALNGGEYTVFAPVDSAFAKLPPKTVKMLGTPAGAKTLSTILTHHVISGQLTPDQIDGSHTTLAGDMVKVSGSGDSITVDGSTKVICGGVHTANATVYLIDSVLTPQKM